jgi:hypothetical protein
VSGDIASAVSACLALREREREGGREGKRREERKRKRCCISHFGRYHPHLDSAALRVLLSPDLSTVFQTLVFASLIAVVFIVISSRSVHLFTLCWFAH